MGIYVCILKGTFVRTMAFLSEHSIIYNFFWDLSNVGDSDIIWGI